MTNLPDSTYKKGSAENFKWSNNLPCDILLLSLKQNKAIYHITLGLKIHILSKKSHFENLNFHKIRIFEISIFTKCIF